MTAYGTAEGCATYHEERGNAAWAAASDSPDDAREAARLKASDYIDGFRARFPGSRTDGRSQDREWPRINAFDRSGEEIADDEVPVEILHATYEAALLVIQGVSLTPVLERGGAVKRKRVTAGPVETETEFMDSAQATSRFVAIERILSGLLSDAGSSVELLRV